MPESSRNAAERLDTVAAFIWNAYRRPHFPGMPEWKDASPIQRMACEDDAHAILSALDALDARRSTEPQGITVKRITPQREVDALNRHTERITRRPTETPRTFFAYGFEHCSYCKRALRSGHFDDCPERPTETPREDGRQ